MIDIRNFDGEDFKTAVQFEGWKIGLLRYSERFSKLCAVERHALTDEAFVLLDGTATLYLRDDQNNFHKYPMEKCTVYNVKQNVWHHIVVSKDATVLVVENSSTSKENTQKEMIL